ncbi:MAG: integrase arm-type DNA-binding domain-containing protein, partial [Proteobacteria bacterium]|nr:integrase arm-type DNA-binding domain-containing protein [Pseudomonadota bacterium]
MKAKLTDIHLRNAKAREHRYELRDGGGLALWVSPSGRRSWVYTYKLPDGSGGVIKIRWVLGEYPSTGLAEARSLHDDARKKVKRGIDPKAEHAREVMKEAERRETERRDAERQEATMEGLCSLYIELYAKPNKRSWAEDDRQLKLDAIPAWRSRPPNEITRRDVQSLLDDIAARSAPVSANRMKALLSRLFRWALAREYVDLNPVAGIELPARETPRDRVLTEEEVRLFWRGLDATPLSDATKRALRLILVTAQRPGEVAGLCYEEIGKLDGRVLWTIPGGRRKSGETHVVPLSPLALEIIGEWEGRTGIAFEGAPPRRRQPSQRLEDMATTEAARKSPITTRALGYALRRNIGEPDQSLPRKHGKRKRRPIQVAPFSPHDLRRTAATLMSNAGVAGLVKPMILGHSPQGITQAVYD